MFDLGLSARNKSTTQTFKMNGEVEEHFGRPSDAFFRSMELSAKSSSTTNEAPDIERKPFGWKTITSAIILLFGGLVKSHFSGGH